MDHPQYAVVFKMVLWGDPREEIENRLRVDGISGSVAERIFARAQAGRVATIRAYAFRKILFGCMLLLLTTVVFCFSSFVLNFFGNYRFALWATGFGVGAWKTIDGTAAWFMAPSKTGPVADDH